jgi:nitrile hydratase beta subunit
MNGIHDMGGMQGMGPIRPEQNEPVFHAPWEGRVQAMGRAVTASGKVHPATNRRFIEKMPAIDYLRASYYERTLTGLTERMISSGVVARAEIDSGRAAAGTVKAVPALKPDTAATYPLRSIARLTVEVAPRFQVEQRVRTRNLNPIGHTRLPRYARGRTGTIEMDRGVWVFPDTDVYSLGEKPQHVYSVRFAARELWGDQASPRDAVYIDLWDNYLEHA